MDSKSEFDQVNLAHVARKIYKQEETETNKRQCRLSSVSLRFQIREGSSEGIRKTMEERGDGHGYRPIRGFTKVLTKTIITKKLSLKQSNSLYS